LITLFRFSIHSRHLYEPHFGNIELATPPLWFRFAAQITMNTLRAVCLVIYYAAKIIILGSLHFILIVILVVVVNDQAQVVDCFPNWT